MGHTPSNFSFVYPPSMTAQNREDLESEQHRIFPLNITLEQRTEALGRSHFGRRSLDLAEGQLLSYLDFFEIRRLIFNNSILPRSCIKKILAYACQTGDLELVEKTYDMEIFEANFYQECVTASLQNYHPYVASFLAGKIRFCIVNRSKIFEEAATYGHLSLAKQMCQKGIFKASLLKGLNYAGFFGFIPIVEYIVGIRELTELEVGPSLISLARVNRVDCFKIIFEKYKDSVFAYQALLEASRLGNVDIVRVFLQNGLSTSDRIAAAESALGANQFEVVHVLFASSPLDEDSFGVLGPTLTAEQAAGLVLMIDFSSISQQTLANIFVASVGWNLLDVARTLIGYVNYEQRMEALSLADARGFSSMSIFLLEHMQTPVQLLGSDVQTWVLERKTIKLKPLMVLKEWSELPIKPSKIIFSDEEGVGDGLRRQFYVELTHAVLTEVIDEDKQLNLKLCSPEIFSMIGQLFSYLFDAKILVGEFDITEMNGLLAIICKYTEKDRFINEFILRRRTSTMLQRELLFQLIEKPDTRLLQEQVLKTFQNPSFLFQEDNPLEKRKEFYQDYLIKNYFSEIFLDFFELQAFEMDDMLPSIFQRIALLECCDPLETKKDLMEFARCKKKDILTVIEKKYDLMISLYASLSDKFVAQFNLVGEQVIVGETLDTNTCINICYQGTDPTIHQKVDLLKTVIATKFKNKEFTWIKNFLFFTTGSYAMEPLLQIGVMPLPQEFVPQSQTCFKILKIATGLDIYPKNMKSWQDRFLSKLDRAIKDDGYQLEPRE